MSQLSVPIAHSLISDAVKIVLLQNTVNKVLIKVVINMSLSDENLCFVPVEYSSISDLHSSCKYCYLKTVLSGQV